jgi:hypothetical protein
VLRSARKYKQSSDLMDFLSSQLVPAIIVLMASLLSGHHNSIRWETITAIFGWAAALSLALGLLAQVFIPESAANKFLFQIFGFSMLTALSRDYERILRPLFNKLKQP